MSSGMSSFVVDGFAKKAASPTYLEWQLYDQRNDPHELVNLAGVVELAACEDGFGEIF